MTSIRIDYKAKSFELINKNLLEECQLSEESRKVILKQFSSFENNWAVWLFSQSPCFHLCAWICLSILFCFTLVIPVLGIVSVILICCRRTAYYSYFFRSMIICGKRHEKYLESAIVEVEVKFKYEETYKVLKLWSNPRCEMAFIITTSPIQDQRRKTFIMKLSQGSPEDNPKIESADERTHHRNLEVKFRNSPDMDRRHLRISHLQNALLTSANTPLTPEDIRIIQNQVLLYTTTGRINPEALPRSEKQAIKSQKKEPFQITLQPSGSLKSPKLAADSVRSPSSLNQPSETDDFHRMNIYRSSAPKFFPET